MVAHFVTPASRPENLLAVLRSLECSGDHSAQVVWWVVYDADSVPCDAPKSETVQVRTLNIPSFPDSKFGGLQRNLAIDQIQDGWVCFIDDDTTVHPDLLKTIGPLLTASPGSNFVWNQAWKNGQPRCRIGIERMKTGFVDTGQVALRREDIGEIRWATRQREADGKFIGEVFAACSDHFLFINRTLSIYNALR